MEAAFFVQGGLDEQIGRPARPEVLREIARVTRGKSCAPDELDEVLRGVYEEASKNLGQEFVYPEDEKK